MVGSISLASAANGLTDQADKLVESTTNACANNSIDSDCNLTISENAVAKGQERYYQPSKSLFKEESQPADRLTTIDRQLSKNYASSECAKVVETNPEAKKSSHVINEMTDEYMLNPCNTKIWFVIELCETIQATHIKIANYELFSSTPKDLTVYFSDVYPALDWKLVGQFTASDSRTLQTFDLNQVGFGKFIRVELHSHYGNEHYCPISEVKVYGNSMVDEYEKSEKTIESNTDVKPFTSKTNRKHKRKTSAYKVYHSMMTQPDGCGLTRSLEDRNDYNVDLFNPKKKQPSLLAQPQPTQQPQVVNRTTPLKPSIFVELSNKVKALETSLNAQKNESDRRLEEIGLEFEKFRVKLRSRAYMLGMIVIAYCVYNLMLDLM